MPQPESLRTAWLGHPLPAMLALTFSTGVVDAVGYLGLDQVFTANMTGNVVILGMGLAGAGGLPVIGPLLALAGFFAGAAAAGRTLRRASDGWNRPTVRLFVTVGVALLVLAAALAFGGGAQALLWTITALLGVAMGVQAGGARHLGVKDVTTVVVTSTLTALASDLTSKRADAGEWRRRIAAVALIMLGAVIGALLVQIHPALGLALAALITLAVAWSGTIARPTHRTVRTA